MDATETDKATLLLLSLRQQIDEHEPALIQMIEALTDEQMESLRTTVEYLWGKSYSKEVFNKSTLLKLMREQLNFRQFDVNGILKKYGIVGCVPRTISPRIITNYGA